MASAKQYPFYTAFWKGFYEREFYVNVASSWRWRGFIFMAVIVVLTVLPASILVAKSANQLFNEELPHILPHFPELKVVDGKLTTEAEQPIYLTGSENKRVIAIDTTGKTQSPQEADAQLLLTADQLIVRMAGEAVLPFPLILPPDAQKISGNTLVAMHQSLQDGGYVSFALGAILMTYVFRLVVSVLYAFAAMFFARNQNLDMGFGALYQIALVAHGLSLVAVSALAFLLALVGVVSLGTMGGVLIALFLVWFGVKANRDWLMTGLPPIKERF
ncbi:MAG: DUF1189 domain-containing protein [Alphaproteobacteria bacterium]|nr:DUF1189 domain-containing protein [Alphaproteobacteria bacterium]